MTITTRQSSIPIDDSQTPPRIQHYAHECGLMIRQQILRTTMLTTPPHRMIPTPLSTIRTRASDITTTVLRVVIAANLTTRIS